MAVPAKWSKFNPLWAVPRFDSVGGDYGMKVEVDPDDVMKLSSDDRGRVYLGSEYADLEGIEIAVLNDPTENTTESDGDA